MTQQNVQDIFQAIMMMIKNKTLDGASLITITVDAMEFVEQIPSLSGADKKAIVLEVITLIINACPIDDNIKSVLDTIVANVLPTVIDTIVAATHNGVNINTLKIKLAKMCACCPPSTCCKK